MEQPQLIPFSENLAQTIKDDYLLPSDVITVWRSRGNIPKAYLTEAFPIPLKNGRKTETRTLHCWRVRLGINSRNLAVYLGVTLASYNNYENGKFNIKSENKEKLISYLQNQLNHARI